MALIVVLAAIASAATQEEESLCYRIRYDFANAAGARSQLLVPITRFPSGHASLPTSAGGASPCAVNYTAGSKIPATGLGSASSDAEDCEVRTAGELWYAYGYPDHSSSNTGYEVQDTVVIYLIVDESGNTSLVVVLDKPIGSSTANNKFGLFIDSPSIAGQGCTVMLFDDGPLDEREDDGCSAKTGSSTSLPDCWSYDDATGTGNLFWRWKTCCTDGFSFGVMPADFCLNLEIPTYLGLDNVAFGSAAYQTEAEFRAADATNDSIALLSFPIDIVDAGLQVCGYSCADYCATYSDCSSCAHADGCSWCSANQTCLYEGTASEACASNVTTADDCCLECSSRDSFTSCVSADCYWCFSTGQCYSGFSANTTCSECPSGWIATVNATVCEGALNATGGLVDDVETMPVSAWCGGHGTCDFARGECDCDPAYWGDGCLFECPGGVHTPCNNAGICDQSTGECYCACGYSGSKCQSLTEACRNQCEHANDDFCYVGDYCDVQCGKDLGDYCTSIYAEDGCAFVRVLSLCCNEVTRCSRRVHRRLARRQLHERVSRNRQGDRCRHGVRCRRCPVQQRWHLQLPGVLLGHGRRRPLRARGVPRL